MVSLQSILFLFLLQLQQPAPEIRVYQVEKEGLIEIWAENENIYPVTLTLRIDKTNLQSNKGFPLMEVVNAGENKKLVYLTVINKRQEWEYKTRYSFFMGDAFAKHNDDFAYRLPYRIGSSQRISQGYDGDFSHKGQLQYSVDFNMEEGTQIYAARSGIVIDVVQKYSEGGIEPKFSELANNITILHEDGSFADYSHLRINGAVVTVGQRVRTGQFIGYSGATGFVTGPHLHFGIKMVQADGSYTTIPVKFSTRNGPVQLEEGQSYIAY